MTRTRILSVHWFRRRARQRERELQAMLNAGFKITGAEWARGVRVEHAGPFQFAVVATEARER